MLRAIYFDNQLCRSAVKVHNKFADDSLFVNFYRIFPEKKIPELALMGVISLRSRRAFSNWLLSFGIVIFLPSQSASPPALPKGEPRAVPNTLRRKAYRSAPLHLLGKLGFINLNAFSLIEIMLFYHHQVIALLFLTHNDEQTLCLYNHYCQLRKACYILAVHGYANVDLD